MKSKFFLQLLHNWYRQIVRHPKYGIWVILASLLYLVSPFDLSTDFIPIVGWIDDGLIVTMLATELSQVLLKQAQTRKQKATEDSAIPATETVAS
jgi:uncharacterized membrane protein YkvA (DUF1232 family)